MVCICNFKINIIIYRPPTFGLPCINTNKFNFKLALEKLKKRHFKLTSTTQITTNIPDVGVERSVGRGLLEFQIRISHSELLSSIRVPR